LPGEVILQTFLPDHPLLKLAAAQNYELFAKRELEERKTFSFPPFCKLIKLVFTGADERLTASLAESVREELLQSAPKSAQLLPLAPSGHAKVKDLYRFQFLIKTPSIQPFSESLLRIRQRLPKGVCLLIDVDPLSTFF
jgi:primosomal protein N' (replication factor Y)